ncbi:MAG: hypothetical protein KKE79_04425, partial [Actinobacteria bacterium]|nr:hypothetical protein [Actinomycetota bacterium]MCG2794711.1 hypothetical protein [Actinomycetes bacterium]
MSKQGRTVSVTPAEGREFLEMARGFERAAEYSLKMGDWKVAGSNAIHCVISANDALLGMKHRVRSAGTRHSDAAPLLRRLEPGDDAKKNAYSGPSFLGHGLRVNLSSKEVVRWDRQTREKEETMARWAERSEGVARA